MTADEVYSSVAFRTACRALGLAYVVAVPAIRQVTTPDHRRRTCTGTLRLIPAAAWARMRTGSAAKGAKDYDWALLAIDDDDAPATDDATDHKTDASERGRPTGHSALLARRHCWPIPSSPPAAYRG